MSLTSVLLVIAAGFVGGGQKWLYDKGYQRSAIIFAVFSLAAIVLFYIYACRQMKNSFLPLLTALLLSACVATTPAPEPADPGQTAYFGVALYGDRVFDRDVLGLRDALVARHGRLQDQAMFGQHLPQLTRPSPEGPRAAVMRLAEGARDGQDVVVVLLTTHGAPGMLAVNERGSDQVGGVTDAQLRDFLAPLNSDRQVVIVQACYSGSLIPALAHPNRIISPPRPPTAPRSAARPMPTTPGSCARC